MPNYLKQLLISALYRHFFKEDVFTTNNTLHYFTNIYKCIQIRVTSIKLLNMAHFWLSSDIFKWLKNYATCTTTTTLLIYIKLLISQNYPLLPFPLLLFPLLSCSSLFLVCLSSGITWSLLLPCFSFLGYIPSLRFWFLSLLVGNVSWMPSCLKYKVNNYVP